jgi:hypothetical protein
MRSKTLHTSIGVTLAANAIAKVEGTVEEMIFESVGNVSPSSEMDNVQFGGNVTAARKRAILQSCVQKTMHYTKP